MKRIICIGNPFAGSDSAGGRVFVKLSHMDLPAGVAVVDGGLRGIDLLSLVQASERVVFVDSVSGFANPGEVVALEGEILQGADAARCDHAGGFAYLLRALPYLVQPPVPLRLVGLEDPVSDEACTEAARLALDFVTLPAEGALSGTGAEA